MLQTNLLIFINLSIVIFMRKYNCHYSILHLQHIESMDTFYSVNFMSDDLFYVVMATAIVNLRTPEHSTLNSIMRWGYRARP